MVVTRKILFDPRKLTFPELPVWSYALDPLDGRYMKVAKELGPYFGEPSLMGYRFGVEIGWLINFIKVKLPLFNNEETIAKLRDIEASYGEDVFNRIKSHEKKTKHDVKAVEKTIGDLLEEKGLECLKPYVHIGCTSEDINNLAYALMWKDALNNVMFPKLKGLMKSVANFARLSKDIPMLARTHGQPASPTTMGKEYANFLSSLMDFYKDLEAIVITGKFNGATGNYSAIDIAYPEEDWEEISRMFIEDYLGLKMQRMTTQIEPHEFMCKILLQFQMIGLKLAKLDVDTWLYISYENISQEKDPNATGSSTMPHKINPITFENSESHIKLLTGMINAFVEGLMRSRMQRDLSDSALQRYCGVAFGLLYQAMDQAIAGLGKIAPNEDAMAKELESNPQVLAEAIQTILRKEGTQDAYDVLKDLTRGNAITLADLRVFVADTPYLNEEEKGILFNLTPSKYIGKAAKLTEDCLKLYEEKFAEAA